MEYFNYLLNGILVVVLFYFSNLQYVKYILKKIVPSDSNTIILQALLTGFLYTVIQIILDKKEENISHIR
jgi:hypothetical protein